METIGFIDGLFKYSQVEDLVLDAEGFYPWVIKVTTKDKKHNQYEETRFDYEAQKAVRLRTKNGQVKEPSQIDLPGFVQDGLSLQYYLRREQAGADTNRIYYYENGKIKNITFTVRQVAQTVQLESGTYSKYLQVNDDNSGITVLISQNSERLPIVIKSIANFGAIEMKLSKIAN
jgi:hypothetical protein